MPIKAKYLALTQFLKFVVTFIWSKITGVSYWWGLGRIVDEARENQDQGQGQDKDRDVIIIEDDVKDAELKTTFIDVDALEDEEDVAPPSTVGWVSSETLR